MLESRQRSACSGFARRMLFPAAVLLALVVLAGAQPAQAQTYYSSMKALSWSHGVNTRDHLPYYLPSYDRRCPGDWHAFWSMFYRDRYRGQYYWYPWTWRWGRYDVPSDYWWAFGEGFVDEYGAGVVYRAGDPRLAAWGAMARVKPLQRIDPAVVRAAADTTRMTGQTRFRGSTMSGGISRGGSSLGFSGGGGRSISSGGKRK